jgi:hypothetical protein
MKGRPEGETVMSRFDDYDLAPQAVSVGSQDKPDPCLSQTGEGAAKPRGLEAGVAGTKCPGRRGRRRLRRRVRVRLRSVDLEPLLFLPRRPPLPKPLPA